MDRNITTPSWYLYVGGEAFERHIDVFRYNLESGEVQPVQRTLEGVNLGSMKIDAGRGVLYCAHHFEDNLDFGTGEGGGGQIYACKIDPETGMLTELCRVSSFGSLPTMMELSADGRYLMVVNHSLPHCATKVVKAADGRYFVSKVYDDSTTVLFPLEEDGTIGAPVDVFYHGGCSGMTAAYNPHPHCCVRSPLYDNLYVVCDKGSDRITMFRIDREKQRLSVASTYDTLPRTSPRYAQYHPTKPFLFTNNEARPVVMAFSYDENGQLSLIHSVRSLPEGIDCDGSKKGPLPADLKIHPNGKYLYTLCRGADLITVFEINQETGALALRETCRLDGNSAKACAVSPDGRFLFVTAKNDNRIVRYDIGSDGCLSPSNYTFETGAPDCMAFYKPYGMTP